MDLRQTMEDLNSLNVEDLRRIGTAPKPVRVLAIVAVCVAVALLGSYLFIKPKIDQLERAERQEPTLKTQFDDVQNKAANLGAYNSIKSYPVFGGVRLVMGSSGGLFAFDFTKGFTGGDPLVLK